MGLRPCLAVRGHAEGLTGFQDRLRRQDGRCVRENAADFVRTRLTGTVNRRRRAPAIQPLSSDRQGAVVSAGSSFEACRVLTNAATSIEKTRIGSLINRPATSQTFSLEVLPPLAVVQTVKMCYRKEHREHKNKEAGALRSVRSFAANTFGFGVNRRYHRLPVGPTCLSWLLFSSTIRLLPSEFLESRDPFCPRISLYLIERQFRCEMNEKPNHERTKTMKAIAPILSRFFNPKSLSHLLALILIVLALPGCATSNSKSVRSLDASWQSARTGMENDACKESHLQLLAVNLKF